MTIDLESVKELTQSRAFELGIGFVICCNMVPHGVDTGGKLLVFCLELAYDPQQKTLEATLWRAVRGLCSFAQPREAADIPGAVQVERSNILFHN